MDVIFELAQPEDAEELYEIQKLAYKEQLEMYKDYDTNPAVEGIEWVFFKIKNHIYFKIIADGKTIGEIDIYQHRSSPTQYEMNGIFVHPLYQNKGIGKTAMKFIEDKFKEAHLWTAWTPHKTEKNHYFYQKLGYKKTGKEEKISDNLTLIQYEKQLMS